MAPPYETCSVYRSIREVGAPRWERFTSGRTRPSPSGLTLVERMKRESQFWSDTEIRRVIHVLRGRLGDVERARRLGEIIERN